MALPLAVMLFCVIPPVHAQNVLTLSQALTEARSNNAGVVRQQNNIASATWQTRSIRADNRPALAFTSMYNRLGEPPTVPVDLNDGLEYIELGGANSFRTRLEFSQKLWDFGQTDHRIAAARFEEQAQRASLDVVASQLNVQVKLAYYDILHLQQLDSLYAVIVDQTRKLETISNSRFEAELILEPALLQARADVQLAAARQAEVRGNIEKGMVQLARLIGRPAVDFTLAGNTPDFTGVTFSPDAKAVLFAQARANRPEFARLAYQAGQQRELMQALKTIYRPRLGLQADFTYYGPKSLFGKYSSFGGQGLNSYNWRVGLAFEMVLFDGHKTKSQIEEAAIRLDGVETEAQQIERDIQAELDGVLSDLRRLQKVYTGNEALHSATRASRRLGEVQFSNGALSELDLIQLQIAEANTAIATAMQAFDITRRVLSLESILGREPAQDALLISGNSHGTYRSDTPDN